MGILRVHYGSGNYGYITGEIMGIFPLWLWVNYDELWVQEKNICFSSKLWVFFMSITGVLRSITINYGLRVNYG